MDTRSETLSKVEADSLVDELANRLAEVEFRTLGKRQTEVATEVLFLHTALLAGRGKGTNTWVQTVLSR